MLNWKDKQNGVDDVLAEDINNIANSLIETQKEIEENAVTKDYVNNNFANALKGSASGEGCVVAKDVSPLEHTVGVKLSAEGVEDFSGVTVKVGGKNFFNGSVIPLKSSIVEVTANSILTYVSDTYTGNGGISTKKKLKELCPNLKVGKRYILSANTQSTVQKLFYLLESGYSWGFGRSAEITEAMLNSEVYVYAKSVINGETTGYCLISNIQVELQEVAQISPASAFEPYVEPVTYTANADGSVDGVKSIYPSTSVSVEDASTAVNIKYNRDINKAFVELQQAIISLGGNV